jgi:DMSO/TMAO reductase YedYZ molybdopterin-dependent catalytic subunit
MAWHRSGRITGGIVLSMAALLAGPASAPGEGPKPSASAPLTVGNEAGKTVPLSAKDWEKLPRRTVEVKDRDGPAVRYEGVPLAEVLRSAGVPFDGHLRGRRVAQYVLIEARDGYRAVFALAEVDPSVSDKVVLVADRQDGKPLSDSAGPYRLIVPGDKIHSRWVRQVSRITVESPPGGAAPKK